jgi:histidinol-phosphate phosphatase family protein
MKQAIILAGGKGTRLQERLQGLPKPLIDICGKPLLERQIEALKNYGFNQIFILVNHGAEQIIEFCQSNENWDIDIQCIDDGVPLGTAGAAIKILPLLTENFLVVYGDTMFDIDLDRFESFHFAAEEASATLFLHPNDHPQDSDLVAMNDHNQIVGFYPYPHDPSVYLPNLVNAGLYYLRRSALAGWQINKAQLDFGKDIFPGLLAKGESLRGYSSPEYIKDCGTPNRLDKVRAQYESGFIAASNLRFKQKIVFLDRDGTINKDIDQLSNERDFELLPGVEKAVALLNKSGYRSVVVTNQPVLARGECSFVGMEGIHRKMQTLLGKGGAYLDRIYYCPHHPDKGFDGEVAELKKVCNCRKPATGMLDLARQELNADLDSSWMIGDSTADLQAAQNAGVRSILLETGMAGMDEKYPALPCYISPNLLTAVNFILHEHPRLLSQCNQLAMNINPGDFVYIGGLARSGKSMLANCLREALRQKNLNAIILSIDGWLKSPEKRGASVLERYDLSALNELIQLLAHRNEDLVIDCPIYSKRNLSAVEILNKTIKTNDVVIIEGTIALNLDVAPSQERSHLWFTEITEERRKKRMISEYQLRGKSLREASEIYESRLGDEMPYILDAKNKATAIIDLALFDGQS